MAWVPRADALDTVVGWVVAWPAAFLVPIAIFALYAHMVKVVELEAVEAKFL